MALDNISLSVSSGEILTVVGKVGCGKVNQNYAYNIIAVPCFNKSNSLLIHCLCTSYSLFQTSLLMAVCGELPVSEGTIFCGGRIAYTAQQPWVFSASIRQNILFGKAYEEGRYKHVLNVCSLEKVHGSSCYNIYRVYS